MQTTQPVLVTSIKAASDFSATKNIFIGFDGDTCGNGKKAFGVLYATAAKGEMAPLVSSGIMLVKSGAAVSKEDKIQSDADGKAIPYSAGEVNGYAMDAASGADELIRVLLS